MLFFASLLLQACAFSSGCSDNPTPADGSDKPCGIGPGLYALISGSAEPVTMCVPDDSIVGTVDRGVYVLYSGQTRRYLISASFTKDAVAYDLEFSFVAHDEIPATLIATADQTLAQANSDFIWFYLQITEEGGADYWTTSATGTVTVTFNSPEIVVATFSGIELHLTDDISQPASLVRAIPEGYLNLTSDSQ
ncbi:MAG: hypothetical protein HY770_08045 [Chitinivibrionia bacterium]|nr:hypothetical protein [Chitinivibrionia bacterium]